MPSRNVKHFSGPSPVEVAVGERFSIDLDSIPTAGYEWRLESHPPELRALRHAARGGKTAVGGGAVEQFVFEPTTPGRYELRFTYGRSWEPTPTDHRSLEVVVRAPRK